MKHLFLSVITFLTYATVNAQTTATDFTTNDCNGASHTLFSELDQGKIIVVAFVMPCGGCAAPSLAAYNAVQSYASSNPGTVLFYLVDDYGNTSCTTLTNWGNTNSMPNATKFSSSAFTMSDYGTAGMPKIVVLGGTDHAVVYNQNSGVTTSGVQAAINGLLSSAGLEENAQTSTSTLKVTPNPVKGAATIEYSLDKASSVGIEIFSLTGELVFQSQENNMSVGTHQFSLNENTNKLENGIYVLTLTTDTKTESINIVIEN